MAFDKDGLDAYNDVATRIAEFREKYPDGSLQPVNPEKAWEQAVVNGVGKDGKPYAATFIVYTAAAYRTPADPRPGIGVAWEPFPGRTPYTFNSELMNAETSAQGRAIVAALAADTRKGVASKEEVRNRAAERDEDGFPAGSKPAAAATPPAQNGEVPDTKRRAIFAQFRDLDIKDAAQQRATLGEILGREVSSRKGLTEPEADKVLEVLRKRPRPAKETVAAS